MKKVKDGKVLDCDGVTFVGMKQIGALFKISASSVRLLVDKSDFPRGVDLGSGCGCLLRWKLHEIMNYFSRQQLAANVAANVAEEDAAWDRWRTDRSPKQLKSCVPVPIALLKTIQDVSSCI